MLAVAPLIAPAFAAETELMKVEADGYVWRAASVEERRAFCDEAAKKAQAAKPGITGKFLFDAIGSFYAKEIPEMLKRKLSEVTALVVADYD